MKCAIQRLAVLVVFLFVTSAIGHAQSLAAPQQNPDNSGQAALLSNDGQSIGFTGYQKDAATGLYYSGARWYDPIIGQFNAMDPVFGKELDTHFLPHHEQRNGNRGQASIFTMYEIVH